LNPEAIARKMGPSGQFQHLPNSRLANMEDDERHPHFYQEIVDCDADTSDEEGPDDGQVEG
jgi:hypothetical protein